jgi:hypothetical protein
MTRQKYGSPLSPPLVALLFTIETFWEYSATAMHDRYHFWVIRKQLTNGKSAHMYIMYNTTAKR